MLLKNKIYKIRYIVFILIVLVLLVTLRYDIFNENKAISLTENYLMGGTVFADTTKDIKIKVSLLFNSDLDDSKRVDGKDLAILMFFFGKTESEYKSNSFNVNPDINGDKIVDGEDLVILASHFGLGK